MTTIICPNCQHEFDLSNSMRDVLEKELRGKMIGWQKKKEEEFTSKTAALEQALQAQKAAGDKLLQQQKQASEKALHEQQQAAQQLLEAEKQKISTQIEAQLRKQLAGDFENQLRMMQQTNLENEEKLKAARQRELDFLRKEHELKTKEEELELELQRKLLDERNKLSESIRKEEADKNALKDTEHQMQLREWQIKFEQQQKLAEEMRRKAEQGLTQRQGEAQEIELEELLRSAFPYDEISEVGKGVRGADCIQTVRNKFGQDCGRIIYESKRTTNFTVEWIEKLKADMRSQGADVAVIVTQAMPKDMDRFGERDGVWICSFVEVKGVVSLLRDGIVRISAAMKTQDNRGDKMQMLYDYLTSNEFGEQWKAVREGFLSMRLSIQRERDAMEKLWKTREKQLEKVLLNMVHIKGSVEGIAGQDSIHMHLLDEAEDNEME